MSDTPQFTKAEKKFIREYRGDLLVAARMAGVEEAQAKKWMARPEIADAIRAREREVALQEEEISTREERQVFLTRIMRDEFAGEPLGAEMRMKAVDMLNKMAGDYVNTIKHEGGPLLGIQINVDSNELEERLRFLTAKKVETAVAGWLS